MNTSKVNFFTKCMNYLSKTGRQANIEISEMQGSIYQKRLRNGHIALLNEHKTGDTFMLIKKDGSINVKASKKAVNGPKKILSFAKTSYNNYSTIMETVKKEVFYFGDKIEEIARKTTNTDGSSELKVVSAGERKTPFHQTRLAGQLHPAMAEKTYMPDGDIVYIERYPKI